MKKGTILGGIIGLILGISVLSSYISYHNTWIDKSNLYSEQLDTDKVIYDEVWKVIQQQANVSDKYADKFKGIYVDIMNARYGDDGREEGAGFMNMLQESNPQFDASMYIKLMNTIESERIKFTRNQQRLISIHKELKNLKQQFPSNMYLSGKELPVLVTVTSTKTDKTFETGKEDDISLF